jgi:di/tripeptidase
MNATFLGFKWGYIKKFNPTIPNNFATMKIHEFHSKAYWMTIKELCRTLTMLIVLESNNAITLQSCEMSKRC